MSTRLAPALLATVCVAAGCVSAKREPALAGDAAKPATAAMPSGAAPASATTAPVTPRVAPAATSSPPAPAAAVAASASPLPPVASTQKPATPDQSLKPAPRPPASTGAPAAVSQAPGASPKPASPIVPAAAAAPVPAPAAAPTLDLKSLEQRLRETRAIGVFTKLALKNQVDDLLDKFRGHHAGKPIPPLPVLKQNFDGLMMKVLALLQNDDPSLAKTIATSREALWGILSDPVKFSSI